MQKQLIPQAYNGNALMPIERIGKRNFYHFTDHISILVEKRAEKANIPLIPIVPRQGRLLEDAKRKIEKQEEGTPIKIFFAECIDISDLINTKTTDAIFKELIQLNQYILKNPQSIFVLTMNHASHFYVLFGNTIKDEQNNEIPTFTFINTSGSDTHRNKLIEVIEKFSTIGKQLMTHDQFMAIKSINHIYQEDDFNCGAIALRAIMHSISSNQAPDEDTIKDIIRNIKQHRKEDADELNKLIQTTAIHNSTQSENTAPQRSAIPSPAISTTTSSQTNALPQDDDHFVKPLKPSTKKIPDSKQAKTTPHKDFNLMTHGELINFFDEHKGKREGRSLLESIDFASAILNSKTPNDFNVLFYNYINYVTSDHLLEGLIDNDKQSRIMTKKQLDAVKYRQRDIKEERQLAKTAQKRPFEALQVSSAETKSPSEPDDRAAKVARTQEKQETPAPTLTSSAQLTLFQTPLPPHEAYGFVNTITEEIKTSQQIDNSEFYSLSNGALRKLKNGKLCKLSNYELTLFFNNYNDKGQYRRVLQTLAVFSAIINSTDPRQEAENTLALRYIQYIDDVNLLIQCRPIKECMNYTQRDLLEQRITALEKKF